MNVRINVSLFASFEAIVGKALLQLLHTDKQMMYITIFHLV